MFYGGGRVIRKPKLFHLTLAGDMVDESTEHKAEERIFAGVKRVQSMD